MTIEECCLDSDSLRKMAIPLKKLVLQSQMTALMVMMATGEKHALGQAIKIMEDIYGLDFEVEQRLIMTQKNLSLTV